MSSFFKNKSFVACIIAVCFFLFIVALLVFVRAPHYAYATLSLSPQDSATLTLNSQTSQENSPDSTDTVLPSEVVAQDGTYLVKMAPSYVPTHALSLGLMDVSQAFQAPIEHINPDGTKDTISATFLISSSTTCTVVGEGTPTGARAIDAATRGSIVIPMNVSSGENSYTVTRVGAYAFGSIDDGACTELTSVELPLSVQTIDAYAFAGCEKLQAINIPYGITAIAERTFAYCYSLSSITLPSTLKTVWQYAFYYCESLEELRFPSSVKTISSYAFCQANGLETVIFEGDAPLLATYSFTGATEIKSVVYYGKSKTPNDTLGCFNSEAVAQPHFYYAITFYPTRTDALEGTNQLGRALICDSAIYNEVEDDINPAYLFEGAVPSYPQGTNIWRYRLSSSRGTNVEVTQFAWAEWSNYRDLSYGSITAANCAFRGEPYIDYVDASVVSDSERTGLREGYDYERSYKRQDASGNWVDTDDITSPGQLQVIAKGIGKYHGEIVGSLTIRFDSSCTFLWPIPVAQDSTKTTLCAFTVRSLSNGKGTVMVAPKLPNRVEKFNNTPVAAVALSYSGSLAIPETINVFGNELTVVGVSSNSFYKTQVSSIDFPQTVKTFEANSFVDTTNTSTLMFRADLTQASFSYTSFAGCSNLSRVIFYNKKPNESRWNISRLFPSSQVRYYYTVRFYYDPKKMHVNGSFEPSEEAVFLGQATLSEKLFLGNMPDIVGGSSFILEGSVPAYPSELIDDTNNPDRSWYAPAWAYPEINEDADLALRSYLSDSVYAYAEQRQDAFTVNDAQIFGPKSTYAYTGSNVAHPSDVKIISPVGGTLKLDKDYTVSFDIWDDWDEVWLPTQDRIEGGHYRFVITGAGKYASSSRKQYFEFDIEVAEQGLGTVFNSDVTLVAPDGSKSQIPCKFRVKSTGSGRTVEVYGRAIDAESEGTVIIPERVSYRGLTFQVDSLGTQAFGRCAQLQGVILPETITALNDLVFYRCSALTSVSFSDKITHIPAYAFSGCTSLSEPFLPSSITSIGSCAFADCAFDLAEYRIPEHITSISTTAFQNTSLASRLYIPSTLSSYSYAFSNARIDEVIFDDEITDIPSGAFRGSTVSKLDFPASLESIGVNAFAGTKLSLAYVPASVKSLGSNAYAIDNLDALIFEGNPNGIDIGSSPAGSTVQAVVYRKWTLFQADKYFPSSAGYYSDVHFYEDEDSAMAGRSSGVASVRHGTLVSQLDHDSSDEAIIFDGAVPSLPEGFTIWAERSTGSIFEEITKPCDCIARSIPSNDLALCRVKTNTTYPYTGSTVNPVTNGTCSVITPDGTILSRGRDYVYHIERKSSEGIWEPVVNYATRGSLRIVIEPAPGSSYVGVAYGYYNITDYFIGSTFVEDDINGHGITYRIIEPATGEKPGVVEVGVGSSGATAVDQNTRGEVVIPAYAHDPLGLEYKVVSISEQAFYRCMWISGVVIPETVETIYAKAFGYDRNIMDSTTSNLAEITFAGDVNDINFAADVFKNCDMVSRVVYGDKKGHFELKQPFAPKAGVTLQRYYTVRYYESAEAYARGVEPLSSVCLKEGSYPESASKIDYYPTSERVPFAPVGFTWVYSGACLDKEGTLIDSGVAFLTEVEDNAVLAAISVITLDGTETNVPCAFTITRDATDETPGSIAVGYIEDGHPALPITTQGHIIIPETLLIGGMNYIVDEIGLGAFGSSNPEGACSGITAVSLPSSIAKISQGAFINCTSLTSLEGLEKSACKAIGASAFAGCSALSDISFPEGLESIAASAFKATSPTRIVLPSTLTLLGRSAFSDCSTLRELIFAGAWGLDLPALTGLDSYVHNSTLTQCSSALKTIPDYAFAECPSLERVIFELDAADIVVSGDAFANDTALDAFVFAGYKADMSQTSYEATQYYTLAYFSTVSEVGGLQREGYAIYSAGAHLEDKPYVSHVPNLPKYWEFIYEFDTAAPMDDYASAYRRMITYPISFEPDDPAFALSVYVDDVLLEPGDVRGAVYGAQVKIEVESVSALEVLDTTAFDNTDAILDFSKNGVLNFSMPGGPVQIEINCGLSLELNAVRANGEELKPLTLSLSQMLQFADKKNTPISYSFWKSNDPMELSSDTFVPLSTLIKAAGYRFTAGDLIIFETKSGTTISITYEDFFNQQRNFYPNAKSASEKNARTVEPSLLIRSAEYYVEQGKPTTTILSDAYRLALGQTSKEMLKGRDTSSYYKSQITKLTILYGRDQLNQCRIEGIGSAYYFTGKQISPKPKVTDTYGKVLTEGKDYTLTYSNNIQAGTASVRIIGKGVYTGEASRTFKIRRAQVLAGADSVGTAAAIALNAYPNGSKGAIICTSASFPDALSASGLAGALDYPIVLVRGNTLPTAAREALRALSLGQNNFEIVVVGGPVAVSNGIYKELASYAGKNRLSRVAGSNRYSTCQAIYAFGAARRVWGKDVILVTGANYPDALSIAPFAAYAHAPILLCKDGNVDAAINTILKNGGFKRGIIAGGTAVVSSSAATKLKAATGTVVRLAGANRYETNKAVAQWCLSQGMSANGAGIATGEKYPDGLASASLLGRSGSILMLAKPQNTKSLVLLAKQGTKVDHIYFLGGNLVVTPAMKSQALSQLKWGNEALR